MGLSIIFSFLKSYWKPIAIGIAVLGILFWFYNKGKQVCEAKIIEVAAKETERRHKEDNKEVERTEKVKTKIKEHRRLNPINDKRDSCLLSNDPFETDCLKNVD